LGWQKQKEEEAKKEAGKKREEKEKKQKKKQKKQKVIEIKKVAEEWEIWNDVIRQECGQTLARVRVSRT